MSQHDTWAIPPTKMDHADTVRFANLLNSLPKDFGFMVSRPVQAVGVPPMFGAISAIVSLPGGRDRGEGQGNTMWEAFSRAFIDAHAKYAATLKQDLLPERGV